MKAYVIITGTIFGLIFVLHTARMFAEGWHVATEPTFLILTILAAALCIWACRLLKRWPKP